MIGECLDVLPDVLYYHRPAINNLLVTDFCGFLFIFIYFIYFLLLLLYFFSATKQAEFWSTNDPSNNISEYYCFSDQINAVMMNRWDYFQKHEKTSPISRQFVRILRVANSYEFVWMTYT